MFPRMTVYENIVLGHEIRKGIAIDLNETIKKATDMLKRVRLDLNPSIRVKDLGVGKQQLIEIAKALSRDVSILVLDEPTAALNEDDCDNLLRILGEPHRSPGRHMRDDLAQTPRSDPDRRHGDRPCATEGQSAPSTRRRMR